MSLDSVNPLTVILTVSLQCDLAYTVAQTSDWPGFPMTVSWLCVFCARLGSNHQLSYLHLGIACELCIDCELCHQRFANCAYFVSRVESFWCCADKMSVVDELDHQDPTSQATSIEDGDLDTFFAARSADFGEAVDGSSADTVLQTCDTQGQPIAAWSRGDSSPAPAVKRGQPGEHAPMSPPSPASRHGGSASPSPCPTLLPCRDTSMSPPARQPDPDDKYEDGVGNAGLDGFSTPAAQGTHWQSPLPSTEKEAGTVNSWADAGTVNSWAGAGLFSKVENESQAPPQFQLVVPPPQQQQGEVGDLTGVAMTNYAAAKGLNGAEVTADMVRHSAEGIGHWGTLTLDLNARSAAGQQFARALKHDLRWSSMYPWLSEREKLEFRRKWAVKKDFCFSRECRSVSKRQSKEEADAGIYLPEVSIAQRLGGSDKPECVAMARSYTAMCRKVGKAFITFSSWLDCEVFLYIEKLITERTVNEWEQKVESWTEANIWETRAEESRARANWAAVHGGRAEQVSIEDIKATEIGVAGWAKLVPQAKAKTGAKTKSKAGAKAGPKAKAKATTGANAAQSEDVTAESAAADAEMTPTKRQQAPKAGACAQAEKDMKECMTMQAKLLSAVKDLQAEAGRDPMLGMGGRVLDQDSRHGERPEDAGELARRLHQRLPHRRHLRRRHEDVEEKQGRPVPSAAPWSHRCDTARAAAAAEACG